MAQVQPALEQSFRARKNSEVLTHEGGCVVIVVLVQQCSHQMICFWLKSKLYVCFSVFACIVNVDYQLLYHFPVFEVEVVNVLDDCAKLGSISFAHFAHFCYQILKIRCYSQNIPQ